MCISTAARQTVQNYKIPPVSFTLNPLSANYAILRSWYRDRLRNTFALCYWFLQLFVYIWPPTLNFTFGISNINNKIIKKWKLYMNYDLDMPLNFGVQWVKNPVSVLGVRSWKLSNVGRSSDGWPNIYYLKFLRSLGTLSRWSLHFFSTHQSALGPSGGLWTFLLTIHKKDLCPSSADDDDDEQPYFVRLLLNFDDRAPWMRVWLLFGQKISTHVTIAVIQ
jgi:hypothetical protein